MNIVPDPPLTPANVTLEPLLERERQALLMMEVSLALIHSPSLPEMLRRCTKALVQHLDGAFARIWTVNVEQNVLELQASSGLYTHLDGAHGRIPVGQFKIGLIAQERIPHLTNAVVGDPRVSDQEWAAREGMVAFAGYPLIGDERLVGVMALFARRPLTMVALEGMASVANAITVGIERKLAEEELLRTTRQLHAQQEHQAAVTRYLRAANRAAARLASAGSLEEAQQVVLETLSRDFNAAFAGVWQYDANRNVLRLGQGVGLEQQPSGLETVIDVNLSHYKIGWVARFGRPFVSSDLDDDLQFDHLWLNQHQIKAAAVLPLKRGERLAGVLAAFFPDELVIEVSEVLGTLASILASRIGIAS